MNLPGPVGTLEGKGTVVTNLRECADILGRPLEHLARFVAWQVRTSVMIYPEYVVVAAPLAPDAPQQLVAGYIETCMRCKGCNNLSVTVNICSQCGKDLEDPVPAQVASQVAEVLI